MSRLGSEVEVEVFYEKMKRYVLDGESQECEEVKNASQFVHEKKAKESDTCSIDKRLASMYSVKSYDSTYLSSDSGSVRAVEGSVPLSVRGLEENPDAVVVVVVGDLL